MRLFPIIDAYLGSASSLFEKNEREKIISEIFDESITRQEPPKCGVCSLAMRYPVRLACGHSFHSACFERWLGVRASCPRDLIPIDIRNNPHKNAIRVKHSSFIKFRTFDKEKNIKVYMLDASRLSSANRYMFYPIKANEEHLIACALKFFTFHPFNQCEKNKFKIVTVKVNSIELYVCSFPKEFESACGKAAEQFGMKMNNISRVMMGGGLFSGLNAALECPASEKILTFQGERLDNPSYFIKKQKEIIKAGNGLAALGLD
jgi:hypothetical protein